MIDKPVSRHEQEFLHPFQNLPSLFFVNKIGQLTESLVSSQGIRYVNIQLLFSYNTRVGFPSPETKGKYIRGILLSIQTKSLYMFFLSFPSTNAVLKLDLVTLECMHWISSSICGANGMRIQAKLDSIAIESTGRINHLTNGNIPHWCRNPSPVVTSKSNRRSTASIAALPFQVSALFVQPHSHTSTGGGNSLRCESYAANNSSTLPRGTKDCKRAKTFLDHMKQACNYKRL